MASWARAADIWQYSFKLYFVKFKDHINCYFWSVWLLWPRKISYIVLYFEHLITGLTEMPFFVRASSPVLARLTSTFSHTLCCFINCWLKLKGKGTRFNISAVHTTSIFTGGLVLDRSYPVSHLKQKALGWITLTEDQLTVDAWAWKWFLHNRVCVETKWVRLG